MAIDVQLPHKVEATGVIPILGIKAMEMVNSKTKSTKLLDSQEDALLAKQSEENMKKYVDDFVKEVNEIDSFYNEKFKEYSQHFVTMQTKYLNRDLSK